MIRAGLRLLIDGKGQHAYRSPINMLPCDLGAQPLVSDLARGELTWPALGDCPDTLFMIIGLLQYGLFATLNIGGSLNRIGKVSSDLLSH